MFSVIITFTITTTTTTTTTTRAVVVLLKRTKTEERYFNHVRQQLIDGLLYRNELELRYRRKTTRRRS